MFLRKWVVRGLVALVLAGCLGAGVVYQQWTNPAAVRQQVEEMLQKQFPGAIVKLYGARLQLLGGVVLTELRLLRPGEVGGDNEKNDFVYIPQATVYHDKERLLDGQFAVRRIVMLRPLVHIIRGKDGKWNVAGLTGHSDSAGPLPTIVIQQGTLIVEDNFAGAAAWEVHDLNLTLINDTANCLNFKGGGQSDSAGAIEVEGSWNRVSNASTLKFHTSSLCINKELVRYVAGQWPHEKLTGLHLDGKADIAADLAYQPGATPAFHYDARCVLRQISVTHPDLPVPLHNLSATVHCDGTKLTLEKLKAAAGTGKIECHGSADLENLENNFDVELTAYHLPLTKDLAERLPSRALYLYRLFKPVGNAKIEIAAKKKKGEWVRKYCTLRPDDISICFDRFQYPIERLSGFVDYDFVREISNFDAVGYSGTRPVKLSGSWKGARDNSDVTIEISGQDLPLDDKLLMALPVAQQTLAKSFHAVGTGDFQALIRRVPGIHEFQNIYQVHFTDCSIKWDEFSLPLANVSGDLAVLSDGRYEFKNFHGTHKDGEVFVSGQKAPRSAGPHDGKLTLNISGRNIALDSDLHEALKKFDGLSKTWDKFAPAGRLNFQTQIEQLPGQPHDMDISVDVAGCAIEPSFFHFPLHDVAGQFRYHKNKVELTNFTARHSNSQLSIGKGTIDLLPKDGFYAVLDDFRGNPVLADEEFLKALPLGMQTTARAINLKDQIFALQTKLVISQAGEPGKLPEIFWDGQLWVRDLELKAGIDMEHVTGTLACRGLHNGKQMVGMTGNLYLEEATIFKQPLKRLRSHFVIHENASDVMWFSLVAPMFGGDITGQGRLEFNSLLRYEVDLTASQIQLEQFGKHNMGPSQQLAGVAAARLHLQGQGPGVSDMEGNGSIDVPAGPMTRLLNLPLLLDLLKFLGLRLPDRTAFEEAHAAFAIHGNRVVVSKLDMLGSAVSLYGKGEVNLDGTDLQLDMYTGWGRAEQILPSAVRYIPSAISKQLNKIEIRGKVGGNEGDLKFTMRPVPGLVDPLMEMRDRLIGKPANAGH